MVARREDGVFRAHALRKKHPFFRREGFGRSEPPREGVVFIQRHPVFPQVPLALRGNGVKAPVNEEAEAGVVEPVEAGQGRGIGEEVKKLSG